MADGGLVDITLPTGEAATVPQEDLAQAVAAGAVVSRAGPEGKYEREFGGLLGMGASAVFGAGRVASGGLTDLALVEGADMLGGARARADMQHGLRVAKETNPYSTLGGEAAGLFIGAGEGITGAGAVVEEQVAARVGEGLLGSMASMGARGGVEGTLLGFGKAVSEDALGEPDPTGEKLFATAVKDGLLGAGVGAGIGAVAHGLGSLRHAVGPRPSGLLDEVAGTPGAGRVLREDLGATESIVTDLRKAGATSEQAAVMTDELQALAKETAAALRKGGPASGVVDKAAAWYAANRAGGNAELEEVLRKAYADRVTRIVKQEEILDKNARILAERGSAVMRGEEVLNRVNFTERPDQFAKLLDPTKLDVAADAAVKMTQRVDALVTELEQTAMKGGNEVGVRRLRKMLQDTYAKHASMVDGGGENALRDLYMSTYKLKQEVGKVSGFGKAPYLRSEGENLFSQAYEELRVGLEDEAVWGAAGAANREWNETFSAALARRQDFGGRFGVSIDQVSGVPKPEVDFDKARSILNDLRGTADDDIRQGVRSAEAFIDGNRQRIAAIEKYADLGPAEVKQLAQMRSDLDAFESAFADARKEAGVVNRLRQQQLEEQGRSLGGVLGLATDIMTKPLTTMERLGAVKAATERFEKGIENGLNRLFDGKGKEILDRLSPSVKPRAREAVQKEIGEVRQLAANPELLQKRLGEFAGDLPRHAPNTSASVAAVATRALTFLAINAPQPVVQKDAFGRTRERYTDSQLADYERKRNAALHPESIIREMKQGKLNREGIRTVKFVYPHLFVQMQDMARSEIAGLDREGKLDSMPRERKKAISILLETPADGTFEPDFIALMQGAKAPSAPQAAPMGPAPVAKRPIKLDVGMFETEAQQIEGRTK